MSTAEEHLAIRLAHDHGHLIGDGDWERAPQSLRKDYRDLARATFAVLAVRRGVVAVLSLVQHSSAPELPREAPEPAGARTARPAPAWARTEEEAA